MLPQILMYFTDDFKNESSIILSHLGRFVFAERNLGVRSISKWELLNKK